jgi:hypothetical protein
MRLSDLECRPGSRHIVSDAPEVQGRVSGFGKTALYFDLAL